MKKRITCIMFFLLVMTTFMGCNSKSKDKEQQTMAETTITTIVTPTPLAEEITPEVEENTISEEDALNIVNQYVLNTVENAENIQLGFSYEDVQTLSEINETCYVFRVGSESEEVSIAVGFYAVSLDGCNVYVMDPLTGEYLNTEDVDLSSDNEEPASDSSLSDHTLSSLGYQLIDESLDQEGIQVSFPQVIKENDTVTSDLINDIIQEDLKSYLATYELPNDGESGASLEMTYELNGITNKVLSIIYKGLFISKDAAYPTNAYHTLNIFVGEDVHSIPLTEAFIVDDLFLDRIKDGMYAPYTPDLNLEESIENFRELIESTWTDTDLLDFLNTNPNYYLTEYGVIVSIETPHAIGDHLEMAIPYESIESNMSKDSALWQDYMFINEN